MRKTALFILTIVTSLFISGCGKTDDPVFSIDLETDFTIPAGLNSVETHYFVIQNVPNFLDVHLTSNGRDKEQVTSILAARGQIHNVVGNLDYDFVREVSVFAVSKEDPSLKREMFYLDFVQLNESGDLELLSSISELREVMINGVFDMEIRMEFKIPSPITVPSRLIFSISVFDE